MNPISELIEATKQRDMRKVVALLKSGISIEEKDNLGGTSLMWTAYLGNKDMVAFLLQMGANVNARTQHGKTPLMWALDGLHCREYGSSLAEATKTPRDVDRDIEIINLLLNKGADVNASSNDGETPLMYSVKVPKALQLLLTAGADIAAKKKNGGTALTSAAWCGSIDSLKMLLVLGADPNAKGDKGQTALMHITTGLGFDRIDAIRALIKSGADVNQRQTMEARP